jgi:hypothetical protein
MFKISCELVRNSGRRSIHIAWRRSGCSALLDQVECVVYYYYYVNNVVDDTKVIGTFDTLDVLCGGQRPSGGREHVTPSTVHTQTHTQLEILAVEHVLLHSCVVAYGVRCSITGGKRERDFFVIPPL